MSEERREAAAEALDLSKMELGAMDLELSRERLAATQDGVRKQAVMDILTLTGRVQSAEFMGHIANALAINQLRRIKDLCEPAKITWRQACKLIGISTQRADQRLRQADALGEEFIANSERLGVSFRTLEAARLLPEPVREKLVAGEVVDLEKVTKEELTEVITGLARDHQKELAAAHDALTKETKGREKAVAKVTETQDRLEAARQELEALRAGLPADDDEALKIIQDIEHKILPALAVYRYTKMAGRSDAAVSRILASLSLIGHCAEWTEQTLYFRAKGQAVEESTEKEIIKGAEMLADDIEAHDGKRPVF